MTTLHLRKSIGRSPLRLGFLLIPFVLACFALSQTAQAVTPAPDGGYPAANTAEGDSALLSLTTGASNTAIGFNALMSNTIGGENTAVGRDALFSNKKGEDNTATGLQALYSNTDGSKNAATGYGALSSNTIGDDNTANGYAALYNNTIGIDNTADGENALSSNTTGNNNIALGSGAGINLTTGDNNIDIGALGQAGESSTIRIGTVGTQTKAFIAGVSVSAIAGTAVVVNNNGRLGVAVSSARFKDEIKPMDKASEAILALKPVSFHYKRQFDPEGIPQFGLVAEDVAKVNPDLVVRDAEGKVYTVRYDAVNAMLLNEFLKEHRTVQEQKADIAELKQNFAEQQRQIEALAAGLQKVSA